MQPTFEDVLRCEEALYEWAESYDTKDWDRLAKCIAPTLRVDYSSIFGKMWEAIPASDFIQMASSLNFLGNTRIRTQHFVGGAKKLPPDAGGSSKYEDDTQSRVALKGHAHGIATVLYRKVDGHWKFAGIEPGIRWSEYDYDKIFQ